ncbi:MAG: hypothetical protein KKC18_10220, partial [Chloroflexi bacterium]|nr:hypothetical protein [Chloroflexota bacterium]
NESTRQVCGLVALTKNRSCNMFKFTRLLTYSVIALLLALSPGCTYIHPYPVYEGPRRSGTDVAGILTMSFGLRVVRIDGQWVPHRVTEYEVEPGNHTVEVKFSARMLGADGKRHFYHSKESQEVIVNAEAGHIYGIHANAGSTGSFVDPLEWIPFVSYPTRDHIRSVRSEEPVDARIGLIATEEFLALRKLYVHHGVIAHNVFLLRVGAYPYVVLSPDYSPTYCA